MGLSKDGLARFGAVAASHVGEDKVAGLVALVAHGDEVHVEALGTLAVGERPVERTSLFRIASTTKPITATATSIAFETAILLTVKAGAGRRGPARAGRAGRPAAAGAREPPGAAPDGRPAR